MFSPISITYISDGQLRWDMTEDDTSQMKIYLSYLVQVDINFFSQYHIATFLYMKLWVD